MGDYDHRRDYPVRVNVSEFYTEGHWYPMGTGDYQQDLISLRKATEVVESLLATGQTVYLHCYEGVNRSASVALMVLRRTGLSETDALRLLKEQRPQVNISDRYLEMTRQCL